MIRLPGFAAMIVFGLLAGCAADAPEPGSRPGSGAGAGPVARGVVPVMVDGAAYPLRLVADEPYMLAHVAPLTLSGETGPAIRIGGTGGQGRLASHALNAYCTGASDYRTAAQTATVLYGDFGDFLWLDAATGEFVFPMPDCRA